MTAHSTRKLQELLWAIQIERKYSKTEILETYLNEIYLGPGVYGVEAASRYYFNKSVGELTLPEAALIAGWPKTQVCTRRIGIRKRPSGAAIRY